MKDNTVRTYKTNVYSAIIAIMLYTMSRMEAWPLSCIPSCFDINQITIKYNEKSITFKLF